MYKEWNEISYAHVHECLDDACAHEMQMPNAMFNNGVLQQSHWIVVSMTVSSHE